MNPLITTSSFNLKIIFGGRFLWFLLTSFLLFAYFVCSSIWRGEIPTDEMMYSHLFFPALLLIFYPATFGIQNDADNRILEILFGIPGYMYKVWLSRLLLIYVLVFIMLIVYSIVAYVLVYPISPLGMAYRLMYPVLFMGGLAFYFSTVTRNGNATALLIIILGIAMVFLRDSFFRDTMWDISLNPYRIPENIHPVIWESTVMKNRLFLGIGALVFTLMALLNLQKREKFI
ncbi:MAG: hypothetical protein IKJ42_09170 [Bacteroidaceae bacterium]|nr:hypothetical protein [Bacteroidaceae bacterium]